MTYTEAPEPVYRVRAATGFHTFAEANSSAEHGWVRDQALAHTREGASSVWVSLQPRGKLLADLYDIVLDIRGAAAGRAAFDLSSAINYTLGCRVVVQRIGPVRVLDLHAKEVCHDIPGTEED